MYRNVSKMVHLVPGKRTDFSSMSVDVEAETGQIFITTRTAADTQASFRISDSDLVQLCTEVLQYMKEHEMVACCDEEG